MYRLLSYPLSTETPLYGKTKPLIVKFKQKRMESGGAVSEARISFSNHSGTHVDGPKHFYPKGRPISEYAIDELIFKDPWLADLPKGDNELIVPSDLKNIPGSCDILLIRTGFYKYRSIKKYRTNNPGISAEAAEYIRKSYPSIRGIGIDCISISAFQKRDVGRIAHRIFLSNSGFASGPVLLIEDIDLSGKFSGLRKIYVVPLFFENIDSMSCTVIAEFD